MLMLFIISYLCIQCLFDVRTKSHFPWTFCIVSNEWLSLLALYFVWNFGTVPICLWNHEPNSLEIFARSYLESSMLYSQREKWYDISIGILHTCMVYNDGTTFNMCTYCEPILWWIVHSHDERSALNFCQTYEYNTYTILIIKHMKWQSPQAALQLCTNFQLIIL